MAVRPHITPFARAYLRRMTHRDHTTHGKSTSNLDRMPRARNEASTSQVRRFRCAFPPSRTGRMASNPAETSTLNGSDRREVAQGYDSVRKSPYTDPLENALEPVQMTQMWLSVCVILPRTDHLANALTGQPFKTRKKISLIVIRVRLLTPSKMPLICANDAKAAVL